MIVGLSRKCLWSLLLGSLLPAGLMAQDSAEPKPASPSAQKSASRPVLSEATRASTDAAVKGAAKKKAESMGAESTSNEPSDPAVTEFHPAAQTPETSSAAGTDSSKNSNKSPSRKIHGSVYGASGSGGESTSNTGGSVGASSKSGKTSIYVETNRSRQSQPTSK